MDPYDSDSSLEDSADYTDTGVLLGYASSEVIDDSVSHLGGWPTWLDNNTPPPGDFANCKVCNRPMHLLLELHGDLPEYFPDHERRLYVFGCSRKTCNRKAGSIRAFRATRRVEAEEKKTEEKADQGEPEGQEEEKPKQDLGASLFGAGSLTGSVNSGNANPFSSASGNGNGNANGNGNPFASPSPTPSTTTPTPAQQTPKKQEDLSETFAAKVRLSSSPTTPKTPLPETTPSTPWPPQSTFPKPYPHLYLDAEYEILSRPSSPDLPVNITIENADDEAGKGGAGRGELKDAFESEMDKTFLRFSSRLEQNPEQVLRYEFRGEPLLYTHSDEVGKRLHREHGHDGKVIVQSNGGSGMPRCQYCGSERVFELQLAPHAISVLEEGREGVGLGPKDEPGMEWGSIILGVCGRDCAPGHIGGLGWREEWAGVQWEESVQGR